MTIKVKNIDTSTIEGKIAVMQAYKDGAKIAMRARRDYPHIWVSAGSPPAWSWHGYDYGVIEEPCEVWVVLGEVRGRVTSITLASNKAQAEAWASYWSSAYDHQQYRAAKLREVQE